MRRLALTITIIAAACSYGDVSVTTVVTTASGGTDHDTTDATSAGTTGHDATAYDAPTTGPGTTTDAITLGDLTTTSTTTTTGDESTSSSTSTGTSAATTTGDVPTTSATDTENPTPGGCGDPGLLFGPCIDGIGCLENFGCFSRQSGQVCIPTFTYAATHSDEVHDCVEQIGGTLICGAEDIILGWCVVGCSQGPCSAGIACDEGDAQILGDAVCVHPW